MANLTIKTNRRPRELVSLNDIPRRFHADFDYLEGEEKYTPRIVKYKGHFYDVNEFMRTPRDEAARQELNELAEWDGYQSDSYFSGIVLRYAYDGTYRDFERVILGTYFS